MVIPGPGFCSTFDHESLWSRFLMLEIILLELESSTGSSQV
jgi:hypothetical protein